MRSDNDVQQKIYAACHITNYYIPQTDGRKLFEEEFTIEALSQMGNPIEHLATLVGFEMFRPVLEDAQVKKGCKTPAERP